jgi:hypothetical protein
MVALKRKVKADDTVVFWMIWNSMPLKFISAYKLHL